MPRLELVPFVEGEPTSLNWSQALVDVGLRRSLETGKAMELILAFSQIVGVSCEGHTEKLKATFVHILANKANKVAKKVVEEA